MIRYQEPYPFRFNPWKHHLGWICRELDLVLKNPNNELINIFIENTNKLNSNQIDIYTGNLAPSLIINAILSSMDKYALDNRKKFKKWLLKKDYKLVVVSDNSVWVLREGFEDARFIHIHPARTTPNSIRIHGNSLKTALLHKLFYNDKITTLEDINNIRVKYLNLSPVKDLHTCDRINNTLTLINKFEII